MQIISVLFTCTFNNLEQQKHTLTRWPLTPTDALMHWIAPTFDKQTISFRHYFAQ